ncbi:hypothetical protein HX862_13915 [Pseudomonas sp. D5002]|uniref:hypothetical protein n=1 Tax=Pseudomonas sp. D5002 TaxID=2738818 RepID=UPI0015A3C4A7|nr:hypothetical protein [Pseudomonas sp. D5002]NWB09004.1 hypothetical protein [Pseudomonas sp. D5002]
MTEKGTSAQEFDAEKFSISYGQMIAYMDAKFPTTECPQCGKDEGWIADTGNDVEHTDALEFMTIYKLNYVQSKAFRASIAMSCAHCGSIRFIAAHKVLDWIKETPEKNNG